MQVAVAFADEAVAPACRECGRAAFAFAPGPGEQRFEVRVVARVARHRQHLREVVVRELQHAVGTSVRDVGLRSRRPRVERGDFGSERVHVGRRQLVAFDHARQQSRLIELPHLDGVLEREAVAAQDRRVDGSGDRDDVEIDRRGETPIEPQLLLAEEPPLRQRREVEELEADSLLDLVRKFTGEQHI